MPTNPFTPSCAVPGCGAAVAVRGRCLAHAGLLDQQRSLGRDRAHTRLYASGRWQRLRRQILTARPLCECDECRGGQLHVAAASVVHHRQPHAGDPARFFDEANLMSMAKSCHDRLTGRRRGGTLA